MRIHYSRWGKGTEMFDRLRRDQFERDLRHARPEPPQSVVTELSRRIQETDETRARRPRRIAIAIAATAVAIVGAGATGGLGHAKTALSGVSESVAGSVQQALDPAPVTESQSSLSPITASSTTQYQGAGFYCIENDETHAFSVVYIGSQAEYDSIDSNHTIHRYDKNKRKEPCSASNH